MTAADIADAVEIECHGRGYDLEGSPRFGLYSMWVEAVDLWGADSPAALGCLEHGILPEAWGPTTSVKLDVDTHMRGGWHAEVEVWTGNLDAPVRRFSELGETRTEAAASVLVAALEAAPELVGEKT